MIHGSPVCTAILAAAWAPPVGAMVGMRTTLAVEVLAATPSDARLGPEWAASLLPPGPFVAMMLGNNTGVYLAPGLTAANTLLLGVALDSEAIDLSTATYNFSAASFALVPAAVNPAAGWYAAAGQIVDPTATDWSQYTLIWIYK